MRASTPFFYKNYGGLRVAWCPELEGGGDTFGQEFVPVVRNLFGPVKNAYEFAAGAGSIGFSLLAQGLCTTLCLSDIRPLAMRALRETVRINSLENKVRVFRSDGLKSIPTSEKWDLVVSNPPHFSQLVPGSGDKSEIALDKNWKVHRQFYAEVGSYLRPQGSILFQEDYHGSQASDFLDFIVEGRLQFIRTFQYETGRKDSHYFVWSRKKLSRFRFESLSAESINLKLPAEKTFFNVSLAKPYRFFLENTSEKRLVLSFLEVSSQRCRSRLTISGLSKKDFAVYLDRGNYILACHKPNDLIVKR